MNTVFFFLECLLWLERKGIRYTVRVEKPQALTAIIFVFCFLQFDFASHWSWGNQHSRNTIHVILTVHSFLSLTEERSRIMYMYTYV